MMEMADERILSHKRSDDIIKEVATWQEESAPEVMTGEG